MTNLTQEISSQGSTLTAWTGPRADRALAGFSASGPWVEFPTPPDQKAGSGRYFGYDSGGEIGAFLSVTAWRITGEIPLDNYLRTVDDFDGGQLGQRDVVWKEWDASASGNTTVVECSIGPVETDFIARITYRWVRNIHDHADELVIICLNAPTSISDRTHYVM